jgi:hypothetical protein
MTGMDQIECAMAHDNLFLARMRPDNLTQLIQRLDLALVIALDNHLHEKAPDTMSIAFWPLLLIQKQRLFYP